MAKTDDGNTGILSLSKSQKTKGARDAKRAKLGLVKLHGGTCTSCGQTSTSCSTNTAHTGCTGYFQGNFGSPALNRLAELSQSPMLFDGSPIQRAVEGTWVNGDNLTALLARRTERASEAERILRRQTHIVPIVVEGKTTGVKFENGMGEPLMWSTTGKWVPDAPVDPIAAEDPGLTEKVSVEETPGWANDHEVAA